LLSQQYEQVAVDRAPQCAIFAQQQTQLGGRNPQCSTRSLDDCAQARARDVERKRRAEHAFVPDQPDLERRMILHYRHERDEASEGEIDVSQRLIGFAKNRPERQLYRRAEFQDPVACFGRQAVNQAVDDKRRRRD
jgi:hypothetical protein